MAKLIVPTLICFSALFLGAPRALSANTSYSWASGGGAGGTYSWGDNNWSIAGYPNAIGDTANFSNVVTAGNSLTVELNGNYKLGTFFFAHPTTASVTINPGSVPTSTLTMDVVSGGAVIAIAAGSGATAFNVALQLNDTLYVSAGGDLHFGGALSGVGGFFMSDPGTVTFSAASSYVGTTKLSGGTLLLDVANAISNSSQLIFNSGQLALDGNNQAFGTASLLSNSTINLGAGTTTATFLDSSAVSWTGTLTVSNFTMGTDVLRFGTSSAGLTSGQLAQIQFADYGNVAAQIDALGYITPIPEPSSTGLLAGLTGIVLIGVNRLKRKR